MYHDGPMTCKSPSNQCYFAGVFLVAVNSVTTSRCRGRDPIAQLPVGWQNQVIRDAKVQGARTIYHIDNPLLVVIVHGELDVVEDLETIPKQCDDRANPQRGVSTQNLATTNRNRSGL